MKGIILALAIFLMAMCPYQRGLELMIFEWSYWQQEEYLNDPNGVVLFYHYYYTWEDAIC